MVILLLLIPPAYPFSIPGYNLAQTADIIYKYGHYTARPKAIFQPAGLPDLFLLLNIYKQAGDTVP